MRALLGSYLVTTICGWTLAFLVPLYVWELTQSASWTSLTYFTAMAPYILVTPFAGVWSDRYQKKHFLIAGDLCSVLLSCVLYGALSTLSGSGLVIALLALNFLLASVSATHHPMFQSLAPEILPTDQLKTFNSVVNAIDNIVRILAPLLVAALLGFLDKKVILMVCGSGFLVSLPMLFLVRHVPITLKQRRGVFQELFEGIRYVASDRNLMSFSMLFFFVNFGLSIIGSNLVAIFSSIFAVPPQNLGYYYGVIGVGAVMGSLMAPRLIGRVEDAGLILICCTLAGVFALLASFSSGPLGMALIWAASTAAQSMVVVAFFTFRQKVVPQEILGRTVGVTRLISYLAIPPASVMGGLLMERTHSLPMVMAAGGLSILMGTLISLRAPAFHLSRKMLPRPALEKS
jgi:MFS family permease